jgi:SAM-dependent methyltransferase
MARLDYDAAAAAYVRGRPLPPEAIAAWRVAVAPLLADASGPLLDVGAGTGWFAATFAEWFDVAVVAVEPSEGMRRRAAETVRGDRRVRFVAGTAEALPLRDHSAGTAWLSTVIHHCTDLAAAGRELARVLRPGARVLIRSVFPGRLDGVAVFRFFPAARRVAETFPTVDATVAVFTAAGFVFESLQAVPQVSAPSLAAAAEYARTMRHADSTLRPLSDEELAAGLRELESAAATTPPAAVVDHLDLLVLRLPPSAAGT